MYFLPFQSRTRFAAFKDTPEVEQALALWLSNERSWNELQENQFLLDNLVNGDPVLGVFFKKEGSFVTKSIGNPQIKFDGNPKSLLFIFGHYKVTSSSGTFSYDKIAPEYTRREISYHSIGSSSENIQGVLDRVSRLELEKLGPDEAQALSDLLNTLRVDINKLARRNDPLSTILPMIGSESGERQRQIRDILTQISALQPSTNATTIDLTNYVNKVEFWDELTKKTNKGFVETLVATRASQIEFDNHVNAPGLHNPTYADVGSPSRAEHNSLASRVNGIKSDVDELKTEEFVKHISTGGGILANDLGEGNWFIDGSGLDSGDGNSPQEFSFYSDGMLFPQTGSGKWYSWGSIQITGVRVSVDVSPVGSPVILDLKKNGTTVYPTHSNRPRIEPGQTTVLAPLPDDVTADNDDFFTLDIVEVGESINGESLSVQVRYEYV